MSRPRRSFSPEFKLRVVQEVEQGESQAAVARKYDLSPHLIPLWRLALERSEGKALSTGRLGGEATGASSAEMQALQQQVAELQRLVGKKEEQIEFLKKTSRFLEQQNAVKPLPSSGAPSRRKKGAR